mgnify:CR=1 FL=1
MINPLAHLLILTIQQRLHHLSNRYQHKQFQATKEKENRSLTHFLVLAKNYEGWRNLIRIVSESNRPEHYYHKPRLDLKRLGEMMDGNMIGICGHLGSTLAAKLMDDDTIISDWKKVGTNCINQYKDIFGKENFFLESQLMDKENDSQNILRLL